MAITKVAKNVTHDLDKVINYVKNGEKTENGILISGLNCFPENAYKQMMMIKRNYHKEGGILAYHYIQSFNGNREVTPDKANAIGLELANELFGDKYQVLVCTHVNKENTHNHILINSVAIDDGKKYHNGNFEIALFRQVNDELCRKYGLSIVETERSEKSMGISKSRINHYVRNDEKMQLVKKDIDNAIQKANSYKHFKEQLYEKNYDIKDNGKYLTLTTPYFKRNVRIERYFGDDYSRENITLKISQKFWFRPLTYHSADRIKRIYTGPKIDKEKLKTSKFYRLYVYYLYLFGKLPRKCIYTEKSPEYIKYQKESKMIFNELNFINRYKFANTNDVEIFIKECQDKLIPLKGERENLYRLLKKETNANNQTIIQAKIDLLTEKINDLHSKIRIGERCIDRIEILQIQYEERKNRIREFNLEDYPNKHKAKVR